MLLKFFFFLFFFPLVPQARGEEGSCGFDSIRSFNKGANKPRFGDDAAALGGPEYLVQNGINPNPTVHSFCFQCRSLVNVCVFFFLPGTIGLVLPRFGKRQ